MDISNIINNLGEEREKYDGSVNPPVFKYPILQQIQLMIYVVKSSMSLNLLFIPGGIIPQLLFCVKK